jgi:hypothetical protein
MQSHCLSLQLLHLLCFVGCTRRVCTSAALLWLQCLLLLLLWLSPPDDVLYLQAQHP